MKRPTTTEASQFVSVFGDWRKDLKKNPKVPEQLPSTKEMERQLKRSENQLEKETAKRYEKLYFSSSAKDRFLLSAPPTALLKERLKTIDQGEKDFVREQKELKKQGKEMQFASKMEAKLFVEDRKMEKYQKQAEAYREFAYGTRDIHNDRRATRKAMDKAESLLLKADSIKRQNEIHRMEDGPEKKKLQSTYDRHKRYDFLKRIFRGERHMSHEGVQFQKDGKSYTNIGRAFYGGTKPMYKFSDGGHIHLYKEAVTCIGMDKPQGALVTEAASKVQKLVCGEDAYVPAFTVRSAEGKVMGSMQEMLDKDPQGIDLFSLQDDPEEMARVLNNNELLTNQLVREHALDWVLCNFDTKGENFIPVANSLNIHDQIVSIDKEASFNFLNDEGAQHMSYTYKPHANDTFYNAMFKGYAEGKFDMNLDVMDRMANRIASIPTDEYMDCFKDMLDHKYGTEGPDRDRAYAAIEGRKENIGKEYKVFRKNLEMEHKMNKEKLNEKQNEKQEVKAEKTREAPPARTK